MDNPTDRAVPYNRKEDRHQAVVRPESKRRVRTHGEETSIKSRHAPNIGPATVVVASVARRVETVEADVEERAVVQERQVAFEVEALASTV